MAIYSDIPAKTDLLSRKPFAEQIGKRLVTGFSNEHDCVVIGLNGQWGSGKSTLLSYLKKAIEDKGQADKIECLTYDFNPWMFSGQENLQREFLEGLLHVLKDRFTTQKEWQDWAEKRLDYLRFIKWIPKYGEDAFQTFEKVVKGLDAFGSIRDLKSRVDKILVENKHRLFIFLDDLDRLSPDETTEIFQLVKLNTNFKNTVFILAYDREVVENALRHRYGESSRRYLEKIVQVDYKIPETLPEKRREILLKGLLELLKNESIEYDIKEFEQIWKSANLSNIFRSLRDVYRFLNALHFRLPSIYQDVDITDFLLLEIIRIFDYESYERLYQEICQKYEHQRMFIGEIPQPTEFPPNTQLIVNRLFPSKDGLSKNKGERRFSDYSFIDRYFALEISSFDVSEKEFEDFLMAKDKLGMLKAIALGERLGSFFDKISNLKRKKNEPKIDYEQIFSAILDLLEDEELQKKWWQEAFKATWQMPKNSNDYIGVGDIFIDCLKVDLSRLSYSRYLFIYWTLYDMKKEMEREEPKVRIFMERSVKILEQRQERYHDDWFNYLMNPKTWENPPFTSELFLDYYSGNKPSEYQDAMKKLLEIDKSLVEISRLFGMFLSDNGRPRRYNDVAYSKLLPSPLNQIYVNRLPEVVAVLPDGRDKELVSFMLEALSPQK